MRILDELSVIGFDNIADAIHRGLTIDNEM
jgi:hypothetical protein